MPARSLAQTTAQTTARSAAAPPGATAAPDLGECADQAAALLKALSSRDRLMLLCQLVQGERHVTELGSLAGIGQPSLSQQLGVLRGEGLVATRRRGRQVVYRLASPDAQAVLETLHRLFAPPPPSGLPSAARSRAGRLRATLTPQETA